MRETVFASVLVLSCAAFGMAASREAPAREPDDLLQGYAERAVREAAERAAATRAAWEKAALETAEQAAKAAAEDLVKPAAEKAAATAAASAAEAAAKAAAEQTAKALTDEKAAKEELKAAEEKEKAERIAALSRIETRIFKLNHASSTEVAESFNSMWSGDFGTNWKVTKMAVAFPESNAIMVTAPRIILDACEKSIGELDVEAQQVYIEARFVELSNNASHKLGIDWSMLDGMKGGLSLNAGWNERKMEGVTSYNSATGDYTIDTSKNANKSTANLSYINGTIGMDDLYIILHALEKSDDARTFSNPKIIVSSGKKAKVDMTEKYPNVTISAKRTTSGGGSDSLDLSMNMAAIPGEDKFMFAKEAFFSWGIELEVTPRISTNGLINVSIVPTISSRTDWVSAGASDTSKDKDANAGTISAKYPVINVQRLITEFAMSSGTTAVIGGLSRTIESQVDSGIPWLRDWWWIGPRLFGSKQRVKEQKEIIVFVTVGLVDPRRIEKDAGLPKNAVLGRQYTKGQKLEPGDRPEKNMEGIDSLDMRLLEEQAKDPLKTQTTSFNFSDYLPFTKDPGYNKDKK